MLEAYSDWVLLLIKWFHITVGITWIGTSFFFMWLDRSLVPPPEGLTGGKAGELWMVHGGGFYRVEKLLMGPTKAPSTLHWFKWEAYWTWISGILLLSLIFYMDDGIFLLDESVSGITHLQGVLLGGSSILVSWLFYDLLWESRAVSARPVLGHVLTAAWFGGLTWALCRTLSGRAAYIHMAAVIGTWMAGNVFLRIIPRQLKMVESSRRGEPVNQEWARNAKSRSTHNTYLTLPIIFIMISNHFPSTYGSSRNWLILCLVSAGGAAVREFFVSRKSGPMRARAALAAGFLCLFAAVWISRAGG